MLILSSVFDAQIVLKHFFTVFVIVHFIVFINIIT